MYPNNDGERWLAEPALLPAVHARRGPAGPGERCSLALGPQAWAVRLVIELESEQWN
ncbi:MAG: hypothetical protein ACWA6Y_10730 [Polaromonas sp.]